MIVQFADIEFANKDYLRSSSSNHKKTTWNYIRGKLFCCKIKLFMLSNR